MNQLKLFGQAILIGLVTMGLGAGIIRLMRPDQPIKPLLLSLFLLGFVLFYGLELVGGHKKFCNFYNKIQ